MNGHQKGFPITFIFVGLLALAIVAFGAWLVIRNAEKDNKEQYSGNTTNTESASGSRPTNPTEGGKYLVIKEWGVRFPLPEKLQDDAYYGYSTSGSSGIPSVYLRSRTLDRITSDCMGNKFYLYQGISRSKEKLSEAQLIYEQPELNFKNIDGYWYHLFNTGNEAASTQDCNDPNAVSKNKDDFRASFGGAQIISDSLHNLESIAQ